MWGVRRITHDIDKKVDAAEFEAWKHEWDGWRARFAREFEAFQERQETQHVENRKRLDRIIENQNARIRREGRG